MAGRVVRPGDHLDRIAHRHGVEASAIWSHPENARLRASRPGGHMLAAGDYLELPEGKHPAPAAVRIGSDTTIVATIPKVKVELVLASEEGPLSGERWHIEANGESAEGTTGPDGKVSFEVRVTTERVQLVLDVRGQCREIVVGGLDPATTVSGAIQRLDNLGYDAGPIASTLSDQAERALVAFQRKSGLVPSGRLDEETIAALVAAHGS